MGLAQVTMHTGDGAEPGPGSSLIPELGTPSVGHPGWAWPASFFFFPL
jgi:hypothetical protein